MHEMADSYSKEALAKAVIADKLTQMAGQACYRTFLLYGHATESCVLSWW